MQRRPLIATLGALATMPWLQACRTVRPPVPLPASNYREPRRPQFHFTPPGGWAGEPHGLVFHAGRWHLFYQYHPGGVAWGPMHWGHASSTDLLHWQHHPIALEPNGPSYAFTGSVVVDAANTGGFGAGALVALYTRHDTEAEDAGRGPAQSQHLATSEDGGLTWEAFDNDDKPVIPNPGEAKHFRDPKLLWHAPTRRWVAVLAVGDHLEFWAAPDLKRWAKLSEFGEGLGTRGGVWECPDLFQLPIENGAPGEQRWVLLASMSTGAPNGGSGTQYFVGEFDGERFTPDERFARGLPGGRGMWLDQGRDHYAGTTWPNAPGGERILIAWMSNWDYAQHVPASTWRGGMTLPVKLALRTTPQGALRLHTQPVAALATLREQTVALPPAPLRGNASMDLLEKAAPGTISPTAMELELTLDPGSMGRCGVELSNARGERYRVGFDATQKLWFSDRTGSGDLDFSPSFASTAHTANRASGLTGLLQLRLFFDANSAELLADDGALQMTESFYPSEPYTKATLFAEGQGARLIAGRMHRLGRVWP
jgi:fructan beta-fructosidase